jgi:hypothetical protein
MSTGSGLLPTGKGAFVSIVKPDGSTLTTSYPFLLMDTVPRFLDATVPPTSGTYTVRIDLRRSRDARRFADDDAAGERDVHRPGRRLQR